MGMGRGYTGAEASGAAVRVTPYPAGHTVGGSYWHISTGPSDDLLYALRFNHKGKEHERSGPAHLPCSPALESPCGLGRMALSLLAISSMNPRS